MVSHRGELTALLRHLRLRVPRRLRRDRGFGRRPVVSQAGWLSLVITGCTLMS